MTGNGAVKETKQKDQCHKHEKGIESLEYRFFHVPSMREYLGPFKVAVYETPEREEDPAAKALPNRYRDR